MWVLPSASNRILRALAKTAARYETIRCRGCGEPRELTARSAKRAGLCQHCLYPAKYRVTDTARRFWFAQFGDDELAEIASEFTGHKVRAEGVGRVRLAMVASARKRGV